MKRLKDSDGRVHFKGTNGHTLCGKDAGEKDLLGGFTWSMSDTSDAVTCSDCAKLYNRVKNAPWNEVDGDVLEASIYTAVQPDAEDGIGKKESSPGDSE